MPDPRSLDGLFRPRSVAVIGASRKKGHLGRELLHNVLAYEFQGKVFPVNPQAEVVHSIKCVPSVLDIEDDVDLAVVVVPREHVLRVVEECGRKGVRGVVVISAGFREVGDAGRERERALLEVVRRHGMRMIGPNCMGIVNTDPAFQLDATFAPTQPIRGGIGFLSQSGAMGVAILNRCRQLGLGISMFASMGNKADVSGNDLLEYWEQDPDTRIVLMYLESFGNPRNFTQIARRVTRRMPVVAVKSGRTAAGAAAATSHTGALAGGRDAAVDALLWQCGVLRAEKIEDLFDIALAFDAQPLPRGRRVALLTDAGGPAIMATDALVAAGLELARLSDATRHALAEALSPDASVANPVDMLGHSTGDDYARSLGLLLADDGVDAVIALYVPPVMHDPVAVAHQIFDAARGSEKTVLCVLMARDDVIRAVKDKGGPSLPIYEFPESAVHALAAMVRYREMRDRDPGRIPAFRVDRDAAARVFAAAAAEGRGQLTVDEAEEVLEAYGIRFAESRLVTRREDLRVACRTVGFPLVLKLVSPEVVHKTEVGGVVTDLRNVDDALSAYDAMLARAAALTPAPSIRGILVQEMRSRGREMILGVAWDPSFGPLLMAGLGGVYVEVLKDVAFGVHPITDRDADEMVASLRAAKLLEGVRGERPVCVAAYKETLMRVSALVEDFHAIREIDVNPFLLGETAEDSVALDARIRFDPSLAPGEPPPG